MPSKKLALPEKEIDAMIREIRGQRVMLDGDLARVYGVPTFRFNEAIKRNKNRFPPDFMFQLDEAEFEALQASLTSQFAILNPAGAGIGNTAPMPSPNTAHSRRQTFSAARAPCR